MNRVALCGLLRIPCSLWSVKHMSVSANESGINDRLAMVIAGAVGLAVGIAFGLLIATLSSTSLKEVVSERDKMTAANGLLAQDISLLQAELEQAKKPKGQDVSQNAASTFHDDTTRSSNTTNAATHTANEFDDAVNKLITGGIVVNVNPDLNEAYVSSNAWSATNVDHKKTMGYILAHYCANHKGTKLYWVEIKDYNSGKRLMKWSASWGVTFD